MSDVLMLSSVYHIVKIAEPLGIGALAAVAREAGFSVEVVEPAAEGWTPARAAEEVLRRPSKVLGVSLLRDEQKSDVYEMVECLRSAGDDRFIVLGGHAPTIAISTGEEDAPPPMEGWRVPLPGASRLPWGPSDDWASEAIARRRIVSYRDLGRIVDAFMIGEADLSFPLLLDAVVSGKAWREVPGVAYVGEDGEFVFGPAAPKPENLDELPLMSRDVLQIHAQRFPDKLAASINLGRGCYYRCTFCTVAVFQKVQVGSAHRQRSPESVVREIRSLNDRFGVTEFNFEDDNFIIRNKRGFEKIRALCDAILTLPFEITFSIFCRADVVERELFSDLRDAGMNIVFLGLESVHEADLEFFHKGMKLATIFNALDVLRDLGFGLEVNEGRRVKLGFIAWHPLTTYASLHDALDFVEEYQLPPKLLRRRLALYSGIPIKHQIRELGLLDPESMKGWHFRDPNLEYLENAVESYINLTVGKPYRDRIRTVCKALRKYAHTEAPDDLVELQCEMDRMSLRFVRELLDMAERIPSADIPAAVGDLLSERRDDFFAWIRDQDIDRRLDEGFVLAGVPADAPDIFRQ